MSEENKKKINEQKTCYCDFTGRYPEICMKYNCRCYGHEGIGHVPNQKFAGKGKYPDYLFSKNL